MLISVPSQRHCSHAAVDRLQREDLAARRIPTGLGPSGMDHVEEGS
jgi:hypothetical protein